MGGGETAAEYGGLLPSVGNRPKPKGLPPNRGSIRESAVSNSYD